MKVCLCFFASLILKFYTFPSLLYSFDVFIEGFCETLFFSPFEECRQKISIVFLWSEHVDETLPDSISSNKAGFEKTSIYVDVLEILVGKNIRSNKKLELRVSIKLFIESEISYFDKSMLKSPRRKILLDDSFCNFINKGEIKIICKIIYRNCRMFIYVTYNHIS